MMFLKASWIKSVPGSDLISFLNWVKAKNVFPDCESDVQILYRAYAGNFEGKKLEKALYKVRHRKEYLAQKKRWRDRRKIRKHDELLNGSQGET